MLSDVEHLREALASAKQLGARQAEQVREQQLVLDGMEALLRAEDDADVMAAAFSALRQAADFQLGLLLEPDGADRFRCCAATDDRFLGAGWPAGTFFRRMAADRGAAVPDNRRVPEWSGYVGPPAPAGSAIYCPVSSPAGPLLLILCTEATGVFTASDARRVSRMGLLVAGALQGVRRRALVSQAEIANVERAAAVAANEAKSRFLANVSHEIRTPLNGVTTVAQLLASSPLDDRQREMVGMIVSSGQMLAELLNDVLDFAKIDAGQISVQLAECDLDATLAATFHLFAEKAEAKGIGCSISFPDDLRGAFRIDPVRVRQVVGNLLSNAVKFTDRGGVEVAVEAVGRSGPKVAIEVRVRDTGCGFDDAIAESLFRRFEQADGSITRQYGGTGLGLSISRSLAQLMGGDVHCHGRPGEGAEFVFRFHAERAAGGQAAPEPVAAQDGLPPLRILAADDNPTNRKVLQLILGATQAQVTMVENGREAVEAWSDGCFDLILMDLQMPVMDGLAAARAIRQSEQATGRTRTPILALSANAMSHHVADALAAGHDGHVAKPIDPAGLIGAIAAAVRETRERRAA